MKYFFPLMLLLFSCAPAPEKKDISGQQDSTAVIQKTDAFADEQAPSDIEVSMIEKGLIDIQQVDASILVDLKYSTSDNFLGFDVYGSLNKCYLQPDVAGKLKQANAFLHESHPQYTLLVYDGARPRSIQQKMWDTVKTMPVQQGVYVSNPKMGSVHNFGAAVDLTIATQDGKAIDMGTPYDFFGEEAHTDNESYLLSSGKINETQLENRKLLRSVMRRAGFFGIQSEWWHFNACTREVATTKYQIIE